MKKQHLIAEMAAALLILLFAYTAISKLSNFEKFKYTLSETPGIRQFSGFIAYSLPIAELIIVLLLIIPKTKYTGLKLSLALMSVFTLYITCMVLFVPHLPCSCGGVLKDLTWKQHIFFNLFFTALSAAGIIFYRENNSIIPETIRNQ